ncbi:hypothetical protein F7P74_06200 [Helicobacter pullorum NCTC 12824]|uniref:hypothetical protein n=1 Tax=Helicobacter pullorum TaxID=35818 RepID=UPI00124603DD|nr:hypothetical protein [Helicobacter pullorum]KAB0574522.1 hypothetical protein F7P74_06200 [Helicobacter pullorum NCTC 12824]
MGNRCVIVNHTRTKAIYQHWNGGRDSIEPLLQIAKEEYELNKDGFYFEPFNAVLEVSKKAFDGELLTLDSYENIKVGDNGVYIVDDNFKIIGREDFSGEEQDSHNPKRMELFISLSYHLGRVKTEAIMEKIDKYAY